MKTAAVLLALTRLGVITRSRCISPLAKSVKGAKFTLTPLALVLLIILGCTPARSPLVNTQHTPSVKSQKPVNKALQPAENSDDIALALIEKYRFGYNLTLLAYQVAFHTQTYKMIESKLGEEKARTLVKTELDKVITEYQGQWNKNMAIIYAQVISTEKLKSLVAEGPSSVYFSELKMKAPEIGLRMQTRCSQMFYEMLAKALQAALMQSEPQAKM